VDASSHGGARPATREDDGRHSNGGHRGTGPKPKAFTVKLGDKIATSAKDKDGNGLIDSAMLWTVTEITRTHIVFAADNGDTWRLRR
jgi:hypothetical protein